MSGVLVPSYPRDVVDFSLVFRGDVDVCAELTTTRRAFADAVVHVVETGARGTGCAAAIDAGRAYHACLRPFVREVVEATGRCVALRPVSWTWHDQMHAACTADPSMLFELAMLHQSMLVLHLRRIDSGTNNNRLEQCDAALACIARARADIQHHCSFRHARARLGKHSDLYTALKGRVLSMPARDPVAFSPAFWAALEQVVLASAREPQTVAEWFACSARLRRACSDLPHLPLFRALRDDVAGKALLALGQQLMRGATTAGDRDACRRAAVSCFLDAQSLSGDERVAAETAAHLHDARHVYGIVPTTAGPVMLCPGAAVGVADTDPLTITVPNVPE